MRFLCINKEMSKCKEKMKIQYFAYIIYNFWKFPRVTSFVFVTAGWFLWIRIRVSITWLGRWSFRSVRWSAGCPGCTGLARPPRSTRPERRKRLSGGERRHRKPRTQRRERRAGDTISIYISCIFLIFKLLINFFLLLSLVKKNYKFIH